MNKLNKLSRAQRAAVKLAEENGGKLYWQTGGHWTAAKDQTDFRPGNYAVTRTVEGLVSWGVMEWSAGKVGGPGEVELVSTRKDRRERRLDTLNEALGFWENDGKKRGPEILLALGAAYGRSGLEGLQTALWAYTSQPQYEAAIIDFFINP